ncbi:hypothetical protein [Neobacillus drentensis]|uniref:hypothetical protein n=1 Tax=Neobacillus drentensis TaxID=220684 RepID=UPI003000D632
MIEKNKITCVFLSINNREYGDGWSAGCELWKEDSIYYFFSLWLPKSEFKNKTKALQYLISIVLDEIPDDEELVLFYSAMKQFFQVKRLHKMSDEFKRGRNVRFFKSVSTRSTVEELELDAAIRKESIKERL